MAYLLNDSLGNKYNLSTNKSMLYVQQYILTLKSVGGFFALEYNFAISNMCS